MIKPNPDQNRYVIEPQDFTVSGNTASITLPHTIDCSFAYDGHLAIPSSILAQDNNNIYTFPLPPPDILYIHTPVTGKTGRSLPIETIVALNDITFTSNKLTSSPLLHRKNPANQNDNLPLGMDTTFIKAAVAGKNVDFLPNSMQYNGLKMPQNNKKLHNVTFFYATDESSTDGDLEIQSPPLHIECEIWTMVVSMSDWGQGTVRRRWRFGGEVTSESWDDEGGRRERIEGTTRWTSVKVEGRGYQYGIASGLGRDLMVYRSIDGDFNDEPTVYALHIDTWDLRDVFNEHRLNGNSMTGGTAGTVRDWHIRMRYANHLDRNGRIEWRGWSPTVTFNVNLAPLAPTGLNLSRKN